MTTLLQYETTTVRWHNLGEAPCYSGGSCYAPPLSASHRPVYPVLYPEPVVTRHPEHVFVARCKSCHREYHLNPDAPIPPVFCGLGMTHGCGSSEWHVFKRLIEVEEDEYVDDCTYSDMQVTKHHQLVAQGSVRLPPGTTKEQVDVIRKMWAKWYNPSAFHLLTTYRVG